MVPASDMTPNSSSKPKYMHAIRAQREYTGAINLHQLSNKWFKEKERKISVLDLQRGSDMNVPSTKALILQ
jgi:hypothetical protein